MFRGFGSFNAAKEMPFDVEDALILWLSKINEINIAQFKKGEYSAVREFPSRLVTSFPMAKNICDSFGDTKTMLSLLLFYLPDTLKVESKFI